MAPGFGCETATIGKGSDTSEKGDGVFGSVAGALTEAIGAAEREPVPGSGDPNDFGAIGRVE
jgi:hypothetical protein